MWCFLTCSLAMEGFAERKRLRSRLLQYSIQVNDISTGLLALLLLPIMDKTAKVQNNTFRPHLDIVSSGVHEWAQLKVQDEPNIMKALNDKEKHDAEDRYNITKREWRSWHTICSGPSPYIPRVPRRCRREC